MKGLHVYEKNREQKGSMTILYKQRKSNDMYVVFFTAVHTHKHYFIFTKKQISANKYFNYTLTPLTNSSLIPC